MALKPLYEVTLHKSDSSVRLIEKQSQDVNQTRLNENFSRIGEMISELYDSQTAPVSVPTKLSQLDNDVGYINDVSDKQDVLTAGDNITIEENVISASVESYEFNPELLWENSNTTVAFAAQKVSVDLSGYILCGIVLRAAVNSDAQVPGAIQFFPIGETQKFTPFMMHSAGNYIMKRPCVISDSGVTFDTGNRNGSNGTSYAIPYRIYGIK